MMKRKPTRSTHSIDAYEDTIAEVYFDPIDEEGSSDCECRVCDWIVREGHQPSFECVDCGRVKT